MLPNNNPQRHEQAIEQAKNGDEASIRFLRLRLQSTSKEMPLALLITLNEMIVEYRRKELASEAESN